MVVWQGCPLWSLLFVFAMQPLSNCIAHKQRDGRIHGILMPHLQVEYIQACYVDDTHLTLRANQTNLEATKRILQIFSIAFEVSKFSGENLKLVGSHLSHDHWTLTLLNGCGQRLVLLANFRILFH